MNRNMMIIVGVVVLLLIGGVILAFTSSKPASQEQPAAMKQQSPTDMPTNAATTSAVDHMMGGSESAAQSNTKIIEVSNKGFAFVPAEIRVKKGDTVKVTFTNTGGMHDFVIDELNVKTKQISDGQKEEVMFVADKAGTFEYYCSVGNHRQMGMVGKLIVE